MYAPCLSIVARNFTPIIWIFASNLAFTFALTDLSQVRRWSSLPFILAFAWKSVNVGRQAFGLFDSLATLWTHSVLVYVLYTIRLMFLEPYILTKPQSNDPEKPKKPRTWSSWLFQGYKIWFDIRDVSKTQPTQSTRTRTDLILFALQSTFKLSLYYFLHFHLLPIIYDETLINIDSDELLPEQATLFRPWTTFTDREILVRAHVASYWLWESFSALDAVHTLLANFFILIIPLDEPSDWPFLFGSPLNAVGLKKFWTRTWHRIVVPTYSSYGKFLARRILGPAAVGQQSSRSKILVVATVFVFSGLVHGGTAWFHGHRDWEAHVTWFLLNFLGCMVETILVAMGSGLARVCGYEKLWTRLCASWVGTCVGYLYVCAFFFWSVPSWRFGEMRAVALRMEQLQRLFGGMQIS